MLPECKGLVDLLMRFTPAQDSVLHHLNIRDIVALSRTTKAFSEYVGLVERTQFDINKRLGHFFIDPKGFRTLQAKHNILISGCRAFGFMPRKSLSPASKEANTGILERLLVQKGIHAEALTSFLVSEGYKLIIKNAIPGTTFKCPIMVHTSAQESQYVGITQTETPPFSWIKTATLTCDVNFITWNKACSAFAYQAFI
ncbi:hypothetical protein BKA58DRAFT_417080 [Alternaria rosae]|uniref:uncharacterized protein n=1 Tax=Alternaria rosae TaxID=1187941 RepID=UPI001E8D173B|nr:uncharacterized protein BKA58DRAFT_417080 [Alternaria rosae]KAH6883288.1 hypothetical protein BKA58DRAFT_417080 [Alternaria rosae]